MLGSEGVEYLGVGDMIKLCVVTYFVDSQIRVVPWLASPWSQNTEVYCTSIPNS